ncbi:MAG: hypothetical protein ABIH37_02400 [archaeon]
MKTNITKNKIFIIISLILILNVSIIIAAEPESPFSSAEKECPNCPIPLNEEKDINKYLTNANKEDIGKRFDETESEKVSEMWEKIKKENKGKLYDGLESDSNRWKKLYDSVKEKNPAGKFDKTNELLGSIEKKEHAQSLLTAITKNNPKFEIASKINTFKLSQSKEGSVTLTDNEEKNHNINLNLPDNLKLIYFDDDKYEKDGKYAYYYDKDDKLKAAIKDGHQLSPPEGESKKWSVLDKDGKLVGKVSFGDDLNSVFRSTEKGGLEAWAKGHKGDEKGFIAEMDGVKYSPSPNSRRVGEDGSNYLNFKKLGENVHEVEGFADNGKVKIDALYEKDEEGVVIAYGKYDEEKFKGKVDLHISEKDDKPFIDSIDGSALNDRVFFSVDKDSTLKINGKQLEIKSEEGETGYVYKIKDGEIMQGPNNVEEYANRQWEVLHSTKDADGNTQTPVGNADESRNHISEGVGEITKEAKELFPEDPQEPQKSPFQTQTKDQGGQIKTETRTPAQSKKNQPWESKNIQGYSPTSNPGYFTANMGSFKRNNIEYKVPYMTLDKLKEVSSKPITVTVTEPNYCGPCQNEFLSGSKGPFLTVQQANQLGANINSVPSKITIQNGKLVR